ncbi:hypothetical protein N7G274_004772 [Stereocaulon virgatum]|uniref:Pentatricopeptide repeat-containing protein n=1 Tax=Stereocaulon virgatum TaxID=373712 RepID=A0ABR4A8R8_9LECA
MISRLVQVPRCLSRSQRLSRPCASQISFHRYTSPTMTATSSSSPELEEHSPVEQKVVHAYNAFEAENREVRDNIQHGSKENENHFSQDDHLELMVAQESSNHTTLAPTISSRYARRKSLLTTSSETCNPRRSIRRLWRAVRVVRKDRRLRLRKLLKKPRKTIPGIDWVSLNAWPGSQKATPKSMPREIKPLLNSFDMKWSKRFRALNRGRRLDICLSSNVVYLLNKYAGYSGRASSESPLLSSGNRRPWQDTILWCLQNSPLRALRFLLSTIEGPKFRPPRYMVEDCLLFLSLHYLHEVPKCGSYAIYALRRLINSFVKGVRAEDIRTYSVPHSLLRLLLRHSNAVQALWLYKLLVFNRIRLLPNTMLHFLAKFVDLNESGMAMEVLARICVSGIPLSKDQVQSACVRLLRAHWDVEGPHVIRSKILTQMLKMGIKPNTQMYNVIILNMVEAHDFDAAWQTYDMGKQNKRVTDSITYGVLLKGAKLSGNAGILDLVIREANEDPEKFQDIRLVSDILNTIHFFSHGDPFPSMFDFYKQHCDLRPLEELGFCGPKTKPPASTNVVGATPDKYILGQMIGAWIQRHRASDGLIHTYHLYHDLVRQNHPLIAPLAQEDYVSNAFLLAFGNRLETLQHSTTVIKHMLEAPPSPDQPRYAIPTVRTWSILVANYFRHNQRLAGEKVVSMMYERNLQPDKVTWNTLVNGYSGLQDIEAAIGAVKGMTTAGHVVDSHTVAGLGRLWNRHGLLDALKRTFGDEMLVQKGSPTGTESS